MIFPIVRLLTHIAWIKVLETCVLCLHWFLRTQTPVILTFLNTSVAFPSQEPMLRFGVLPSVEVACEECCCCMQRCWFPQTLPMRQP